MKSAAADSWGDHYGSKASMLLCGGKFFSNRVKMKIFPILLPEGKIGTNSFIKIFYKEA